ncbi:hypothetical protein RI054_07g36360 [Pseudoscourfieldia marina]
MFAPPAIGGGAHPLKGVAGLHGRPSRSAMNAQVSRDARTASMLLNECLTALTRLVLLAMAVVATAFLVYRAATAATNWSSWNMQTIHPKAAATPKGHPRLVGTMDADSLDLGLPAHLVAAEETPPLSEIAPKGAIGSAATNFGGVDVGPEAVPFAPPPPTDAAQGKWWSFLWPFGKKGQNGFGRKEGARHTRVVYASVLATPGVDLWPFRGYATRPELSHVGMDAAFELGRKLRQRYVDSLHLIPRHHKPDDTPNPLLATSLDDTRAYDTMQLLLLGLYPDDVALNAARTTKDCRGCRPPRRSMPFDVPLAMSLDIAGGSVALNASKYDRAVGKTSPQCLGACMGLRLRHGDGDAIHDESEEVARKVQPVNITVRPFMYDAVLRQFAACGNGWTERTSKALHKPPLGVTVGGEFGRALDLVHESFNTNVSGHLCAAVGYPNECANMPLRDLGALHDVVASHLVLGGDWDVPVDRRDVLASLSAPKQHLLWELFGTNATATAGVLLRRMVETLSANVALRSYASTRRGQRRELLDGEKLSLYTVGEFQLVALLAAIGVQPYSTTVDPLDTLSFELVEEGDDSKAQKSRDRRAAPPPPPLHDPHPWPIAQGPAEELGSRRQLRSRRSLHQYSELLPYDNLAQQMYDEEAGPSPPPPPDNDVFMPDGSLNVSAVGAILPDGTWNDTFLYEHNAAIPMSPPPPAPPPPFMAFDRERFRYWLMVRHNDKPVKMPGCSPPSWAREGSDHWFLCDVDSFVLRTREMTESPTVEVCGGYRPAEEVWAEVAEAEKEAFLEAMAAEKEELERRNATVPDAAVLASAAQDAYARSSHAHRRAKKKKRGRGL